MRARRAVLVAESSVMAALTAVATMIVQIPVPETRGYINLGDTMVMLSGVLFGPLVGAVAGGVGSALADVLSGYSWWAPFTLVIKGLEGFVVGLIAQKGGRLRTLAGCALGGAIMVLGYFAVEYVLYGAGAFAELPGNVFQALAGIAVASTVGPAVKRALKGA
ncbi:ECF transporter S component [Infirmifilum lucidum]|uniref:ECF transporter S component n=1 Tax=Infirmifilum lucidum TaxID=2776706 RepID=A0A7L9FG36_9CREN|nr:ECF transporter S component [Infirmifilum lucidum]QOJ78760.1 ECF transporter S component [Infirmifilum lucidum]